MSCVPVAGLQLTPLSYAFPLQTTQFNTLRTFSVPYFRRRLPMISLKSTSLIIRRYQPLSTMCSLNSGSGYGEPDPMRLFQGKGMSENGTEASPGKAIEKGVGSFGNGMSMEDLVKEQILNKEYYNGNGGGNDRKPPGGGGGSGDEGMWDGEEFKQVTFATLGIIFVCIYIAERAQINALAKDSVQYVFTRKQSARLKRIIDPFKKLVQSLRGDGYHDHNQVEYEISSNPGDDSNDDDGDD